MSLNTSSSTTSQVPIRLDLIQTLGAMQEFSSLLNQTFHLKEGMNFLDDFPVWDPSTPIAIGERIILGAFAKEATQEKLVSCAGVRIAELHTHSGPAKIALIGAVATHEAWRSRGLALQLVKVAVQWAQERNVAGVFLFSSETSFYEKQGFFPLGAQLRITLSDLGGVGSPQLTSSTKQDSTPQVLTGWNPQLVRQLLNRKKGLKFRSQDFAWIKLHKNVEWHWVGPEENPSAYAAFGKGIDLPGMIHEWGGERKDLISILRSIYGKNPDAVLLGPQDLIQELQPDLKNCFQDSLCLAKIFEHQRFLPDFSDLWFWGIDSA